MGGIKKGWEVRKEEKEKDIVEVVRWVLRGLVKMEERGLAFLNIEPENIFKNSQEEGYCLVNMDRVIDAVMLT